MDQNPAAPQTEKLRLSLVVPMRDEAAGLDALLERVEKALAQFPRWEMIAVDDGSADDTWARLAAAAHARPWLRGVRLARSFGQHPATLAGLKNARGEIIATMDADLQVRPEDVPLLVSKIDEGAGVAFALRGHSGEGFVRRTLGAAAKRFLCRFAAGSPPAAVSTFWAARRGVVEAALLAEISRPVAPFHVMLGCPRKVAAVTVAESPRSRGASKYGGLALLRLAADVFFGYTILPEPALLVTALAAPAGTILLWLLAGIAALANLPAVSAFLVFVGILFALAAFSALLFLSAEIALRSAPARGPLYRVTETF